MATTRTFHVGDKPTITSTFTVDEIPTSPTTVEATVQKPDGTETNLTPTETGTGVWVTTLPTLDQSGRWWWRVAGTAGVISADEGFFFVRYSPFDD